MNFDLRQPCVECPFRRKAPNGWLGPWEVTELTNHIQFNGPFPCHRTIEEDGEESGDHQYCAGATIFMNNKCQLHHDPKIVSYQKTMKTVSPEIKKSVFSNSMEFVEHHSKLPGSK